MKQYSNSDIEEIETRLDQTIKRLEKLQKQVCIEPFIDNSDFIRIFKISHSTAKNWRNKSIVPYVQIENKIYYKVSDVRELFNN